MCMRGSLGPVRTLGTAYLGIRCEVRMWVVFLVVSVIRGIQDGAVAFH